MLTLTLCDCFASLFQKRPPARRKRKKRRFLFAKLFLLCLSSQKKKRLTSFISTKGLAAFLWLNSHPFSCLIRVSHLLRKTENKKLTKETLNRLRGGRCYAQGATFEKVDKTIDGCGANKLLDKSKFEIVNHIITGDFLI